MTIEDMRGTLAVMEAELAGWREWADEYNAADVVAGGERAVEHQQAIIREAEALVSQWETRYPDAPLPEDAPALAWLECALWQFYERVDMAGDDQRVTAVGEALLRHEALRIIAAEYGELCGTPCQSVRA